MAELDFILTKKLISAATSLDKEIQEKKTSKPKHIGSARTPPEAKLRLTQPW